jgi:diguanylate cyclase (GGDEF)-like protein
MIGLGAVIIAFAAHLPVNLLFNAAVTILALVVVSLLVFTRLFAVRATSSMGEIRKIEGDIQRIFDNTPLACAIIDETGNVLETNNEMLNLFILPNKKITENFFDLSPRYQPDGRFSAEKMTEKIRLALKTGKIHFEWMHQTMSGKSIPCEIIMISDNYNDRPLLFTYIRDLCEIREAAQMVQQLERLAFTDTLTGAHSRGYFTSVAELEFLSCVAAKKCFSIILLDIDDFKRVNDTFGHHIGDEVLKFVVARARHSLKRDTMLVRYGGEEFIVMLPRVPHEMAIKIALQIQMRIDDSPFSVKSQTMPVTVSVGVASHTDETSTLNDIIKNADSALYHAKKTGKNKVVSYEELGNLKNRAPS